MQTTKSLAIAALLAFTASTNAEPPDASAWQRLLDGNSRFVSHRVVHAERRKNMLLQIAIKGLSGERLHQITADIGRQ